MDTRRLILLVIFSFSLLMLWDAWNQQHRPPVPPQQDAAVAQQHQADAPGVPVPSLPAAAPDAVPVAPQAVEAAPREPIRVRTDLLEAEIDPLGGNIVRLVLNKYPAGSEESAPLELLAPAQRYAAQSGLIGPNLPTHRSMYQAQAQTYTLAEGQENLQVRLETSVGEGVRAAKILTFHRDSYLIDVTHELVNQSAEPIAPAHAYFQLTRSGETPGRGFFMAQAYTGPAVYTEQDKYRKVPFSDIAEGDASFPRTASDGWVAMVQHYFVSAVLPPADTPREYYARSIGPDLYAAGAIVPIPAVAPGSSARVNVPLYAGPQEQERLHAAAPGLDVVVDYGWLTIIAEPLFWILKWFHSWLGNWGLAIIGLTVLIKLVFFPLSAASYKSMAKMRVVAPRLQKLREQYGKDRAKMNQAMMELYKTEKINPLGGCLPILVQIPVFIALYWVLLGSVELRNAPFYGWITDLSEQDPYYILPLLMMVSMFVQTRLSPTPPDPVQAKVMLAMPLIFGVFFFFFPAGLVLYWLVNNILSIAQQWQITRMIEGGQGKTASAK
ncbi:MAG TPA: membrane protein insertase YidC [Burkholderiales bacterium]|nr:membrane protein insertase YidC [Burkholderiales bacterium]